MKHFKTQFYSLLILLTVTAHAQLTPPYRIYAGSTHAHTAYTWSHGSHLVKSGLRIDSLNVAHPRDSTTKPGWRKLQGFPAEHFAAAKVSGYDFYITTDHSQEAAFNPASPNSTAWVNTKKAATGATDNNFVALMGYEHSENNSTNGKGHINVINTAIYLNALKPDIDLPYLYKWLATVAPDGNGPVVATFNHPAPTSYNTFAYRDEKVTGIITMLEVINSNKNVHYDAFIQALDSGWKVSPVAGNDNHNLGGIKAQYSRTFVLATHKTKRAILDAMKNRRTYASFDQNISCTYTVNGKMMGSTLNGTDPFFQFDIRISDPDINDPKAKITKIDIIKDGGEVVETYSPAPAYSVQWKPRIKNSGNKYFFVRVWNAGSAISGAEATVNADAESSDAEPVKADAAKPVKKADTNRPVAWLAPVWIGI